MATIQQYPARFVCRLGGGEPTVLPYPEAAGTQTFKANTFVYLDSNGKVTACADAATVILGMTKEDASGTEDTMIDVLLAEPEIIFEMNVIHGTAASAVTAVTQVYAAGFGLDVATNNSYVKIDNVTQKCFKVIRLSPKDATGDQYGRVWVRVAPYYYQLNGDNA